MKWRILTYIMLCLFVITVNAQTRDAEFSKSTEFLKKSIGLTIGDEKITDCVFNEKEIKLVTMNKGKSSSLVCSGFDYNTTKSKIDPPVTEVSFTFAKAIEITLYENKKKVETPKSDFMVFCPSGVFNESSSSHNTLTMKPRC